MNTNCITTYRTNLLLLRRFPKWMLMVVWILFVSFLSAETMKVWGQTMQLEINPRETHTLTNGATYTSIKLNGIGDFTIVLNGTTTLSGQTEYGGGVYERKGALYIGPDQKLTIRGSGRLIAKAHYAFWKSNDTNYGDQILPALDIDKAGSVLVIGPVSIEATGYNHPSGGEGALSGLGVGGRMRTGGYLGTTVFESGPLTLQDGASFYTDNLVHHHDKQGDNKQYPHISIKNFGFLRTYNSVAYPSNRIGSSYVKQEIHYENLDPSRKELSLKFEKLNQSYPVRLPESYRTRVSLYYENATAINYGYYGILEDVPFPLRSGANTNLGLYKDASNTYYKAFQTISARTTLTLNTPYYPASGILTINSNECTFNGNKTSYNSNFSFNPNNALFKTGSGGILKLTNINIGNTDSRLKLEGQIYIANGDESNFLSAGTIIDNKTNKAVYHNITQLQRNDHSIKEITYGGVKINAYYLTGNRLHLWLPDNTDKELRIHTDQGVVYTAKVTIGQAHKVQTSEYLTVYPTEFDLSMQTLNLTTAATNSQQTVNYPAGGNAYTSPSATPLVFFDTKASEDDKNIVIDGGNTANVTFKGLSLSTQSASCFSIINGAIVNLTLSGSNSLKSSAQSSGKGIDLTAGTLSVTGGSGSSLTLSGDNADIDINSSSGYLNLAAANYSIRAMNSKFKPTNTKVGDGSTLTTPPTIYMGTSNNDKYFLAILPDANNYSNFKESSGNTFPSGLTTDVKDGNKYFWLSEKSSQIQAEKSNTGYVLSRTTNQHNFLLKASPIIAKINNAAYPSIQAAFAAAEPGETVTLESDGYTLQSGESPVLINIGKGEMVTLNLGSKSLNGGGRTLNTNGGVLQVTGSTSLVGTFHIQGGLYAAEATPIGIAQLYMGGKQVYRVKVTNLANGINKYPYFKLDEAGAAYYPTYANTVENSTVIWLPASVNNMASTAIIADGSGAVQEAVSEATLTVTSNHSNTVAAIPAPDLAFGTITVSNGANSGHKVEYGSKSFTQDSMALTADKRIRIRGNSRNKSNQIKVMSTQEAFLTLSGVMADPGTSNAISSLNIEANAKVNIMLEKENELRGGSGGSAQTAITIANGGQLTFCNNDADKGRNSGQLLAQGGISGNTSAHSVSCNGTTSKLIVNGGTIRLLNGDETVLEEAVSISAGGTPMQIKGGSLQTRSNIRPKNGDTEVFMVTVSTGMTPGKPYRYEFKPGATPTDLSYSPPVQSYVIPDADGKIYCWLPEQKIGDTQQGSIVLTDPETSDTKNIPIAKVDKNDLNVAPIVISAKNLDTGEEQSFGNLKDAFDFTEAGRATKATNYLLTLLTSVNNIRTQQKVKDYCNVTFDLSAFNVDMVSGSDVSFETTETGYLYITGRGGNIRNTFNISGDVFINGIVPLTDATVMRNGMSVFRTLISELPSAVGNEYQYTYSKQDRFYLHMVTHNGKQMPLACLWLPDNGAQMELRFTVSNGSSSIEYTAGMINTKTQATEPIPVSSVNVEASVLYGTTNQAFNSLREAISEVQKANLEGYGETDTKPVLLTLLRGVTYSSDLTLAGQCQMNLAGKNLVSTAAAKLKVNDGARIRISDNSVGTKGVLQTSIILPDPTALFVPGNIQITGFVNGTGGNANTQYWRTLLNTSYMPDVSRVTYNSKDYPVVNGEVCLWLEKNTAETDYLLTLYDMGGNPIGADAGKLTTSGVISDNHQNELLIGVTANEAQIGSQPYDKLQAAFNAAEAGYTVKLLKNIAPKDANLTAPQKDIILELGKYGIEQATGTSHNLTINLDARLEIRSTEGTGRLMLPVKMTNGGLFFAGLTVDGGKLGEVQEASTRKYRLLVKNLPRGMRDGVYTYTYGDGVTKQTGFCMVRDFTACLWLTKESIGKTLTFVAGGTNYSIRNVIIEANHFNVQTYGVDDVAQVGSNKYATLADAFLYGSGKKVVLLKNASFDQEIKVSALGTELDMGAYNIMAVDATSHYFEVTSTGTFRITGRGLLTSNLQIEESDKLSGNTNLVIEPEVSLNNSSTVTLKKTDHSSISVFRTNISGLNPSVLSTYEYGGQRGEATTSTVGTLCVWLEGLSTPNTFRVDIGDQTWLLPNVVVNNGHNNPIPLSPAIAVAQIKSMSYNTLTEAFVALQEGETVLLKKNAESDESLKLPDGIKKSTFDLGKKRLTLNYSATFDANTGQLLLEDGVLEGDVGLKGMVFAGGDVRMNDVMVMMGGKTVWRTLLTLPAGTTSFSYTIGKGAKVSDYKNINEIAGVPVACLWLPSSNQAQDFVVTINGAEYALKNVIIASTHGNELDLMNTDPVASTNSKEYASLASAFAAVAEGGTVRLLKDLVLSSVQDIVDKNVTLDLDKKSITSANGGFSVGGTDKRLTIKNGILSGTFRISSEVKTVAIEESVSLSGAVLDNDNKAIYRALIKAGTDSNAPVTCHWLYPNSRIYDYELISNGDTYEATIPINFTDHNTKQTAYKRVILTSNSEDWNSAYENTNLVLSSNVKLTAQTAATLHRLTIHDGAKVITTPGTNVIATEGIHYKRTFATADKWESIALPFTAARIEEIAPTDKTKVTPLSPATGSGTAGYFWLTTVDNDGSLKDVTTSEMTANVGYLMAVPSNLQNKEITFVSGENQLLNRNARVGVQPVSGFVSYANEALDDLTLTTACYVLDDTGQDFVRIQSTAYQKTFIPPFRGYLFADPVTTTITSSLRAGSVPTATETPSLLSDLRITAGKGCVVLEAEKAHHIAIYSFSGRCIRAFSFAGGQMRVELTGGFYIVNGKKIFVKQ